MSGWPASIFDAPLLRGLDARAKREIEAAGALHRPEEDAAIYRAGESGESFFVVASGEVVLRAVRRGDGGESDLRTAAAGDSFGEEATVGLARRAHAIARGGASVAEIPVALFRRAVARSGEGKLADRFERALRRSAAKDLLATLALTRDLPAKDVDVLLDALEHRRVLRGEHVFREGERAKEAFVVADGLVQIQVDDGEKIHVRAYVGKGDLFGDAEAMDGSLRTTSAVASGDTALVAIPGEVLRDLETKHPDLFERVRREARDQRDAQESVFGGERGVHATQHLFRDLYRMQVARSLLVIDLESCVRCGHCAWSCAATHDGVSRLVRRGDRLRGRIDDAREEPTSLLLPSSCQHCENPACMIDCPTGAIGKEAAGDVSIKEALCTGCGACAKACPWDNIQMAARAKDAPRPAGDLGAFDEVAVKCDLCSGREGGPACVAACPVEAIVRVHPREELGELRALFDPAERAPGRARRARANMRASLVGGSVLASSGLAAVGMVMQARGAFHPAAGVGYASGVVAGLGMLALAGYAWPKRLGARWSAGRRRGIGGNSSAGAVDGRGVPANSRRPAEEAGLGRPFRRGASGASVGAPKEGWGPPAREPTRILKRVGAPAEPHPSFPGSPPAPSRSSTRPHYDAHLAIGFLTTAFALAHAPAPGPKSGVGFALELALVVASLAGAFTAAAYAWIPPRLARIERTAALPEDFAAARALLQERLFRDVSGKSELVKKVFEKILLPYVKHPLGPLALVLSGRRLREEEARLEELVTHKLEGRGKERLGGLSSLVRTVVEARALPAQRFLSRLLRVGLPAHIFAFAIALALLVLHVTFALLRNR